jgi:nucleoid-associated protein YgaU
MPNDAKLGLVVGVGVVIAVGVIFYRKDAPVQNIAAIDKVEPSRTVLPPPPKNATVASTTGRRHTVQAGETLTSLAKHYFGDETKAAAIRELNPTLQEPDEPAEGTILVIPDGDRND